MDKRCKDLVVKIATKLYDEGGQVYFVGGCVRDEILGLDSKDIDVEVHNVSPEALERVLSEFGELQYIGKSFGVYNIKGYDIDFALPRREISVGDGKHNMFEITVVPDMSLAESARRRDFTMNAIMQNALTGEIYDLFSGIEDIKRKRIRHIDDKTFIEDPLRVFRAAQFSARFGFDICYDTIKLVRTMDVKRLSKERVYDELKKAMLKSYEPSRFFKALVIMNQMDFWFPEVSALQDVLQNPKYHPEGDVFVHTMQVIDRVASMKDRAVNSEFLMMSALCHDFGKAVTTTLGDDNNWHAYGHEIAGIDIARGFIKRLNNNKCLSKYVRSMVANHMKLAHIWFSPDSCVTDWTVSPILDESIEPVDLAILSWADNYNFTMDSNLFDEYSHFCFCYVPELWNKLQHMPMVTGNDLIEIGLKPSKEFKAILDKAHKDVFRGRSKEAIMREIIGAYRHSNKVVADYYEKMRAKVITGDDLIEIGMSGSPEFGAKLDILNKRLKNGESKQDLLDEVRKELETK